MAALRTDYKEDIFTGNRKYNQIDNGDGTISFSDETDYEQIGDSFGAAQINEIDILLNSHDSDITTINSSITTINSNILTANNNITALNNELTIGTEKFYFDKRNGVYGYNTSANRGADTFHPFKQAIPTPWWSNARTATYTVPKTGLYYLYASCAAAGADDHSVSTTATISRSGSALLTASESVYVRDSHGGVFASNSTNVRLTQGQVLNMSASSDGFSYSHLGQMFVVACADV